MKLERGASEDWSLPQFPAAQRYWELLKFRRETDLCLSWFALLLLFLGVANVSDFPPLLLPPLMTTQTPHLQVNIDFHFNTSSWRNLLLPGPLPSVLAVNFLVLTWSKAFSQQQDSKDSDSLLYCLCFFLCSWSALGGVVQSPVGKSTWLH